MEVQHVDAGDLPVGELEVGAEAGDEAGALRPRHRVAGERDRVLARLDRERPVAVLNARGRCDGGEGEQRQHNGGDQAGEHAADSSAPP
jgi:hypothetical protein